MEILQRKQELPQSSVNPTRILSTTSTSHILSLLTIADNSTPSPIKSPHCKLHLLFPGYEWMKRKLRHFTSSDITTSSTDSTVNTSSSHVTTSNSSNQHHMFKATKASSNLENLMHVFSSLNRRGGHSHPQSSEQHLKQQADAKADARSSKPSKQQVGSSTMGNHSYQQQQVSARSTSAQQQQQEEQAATAWRTAICPTTSKT